MRSTLIGVFLLFVLISRSQILDSTVVNSLISFYPTFSPSHIFKQTQELYKIDEDSNKFKVKVFYYETIEDTLYKNYTVLLDSNNFSFYADSNPNIRYTIFDFTKQVKDTSVIYIFWNDFYENMGVFPIEIIIDSIKSEMFPIIGEQTVYYFHGLWGTPHLTNEQQYWIKNYFNGSGGLILASYTFPNTTTTYVNTVCIRENKVQIPLIPNGCDNDVGVLSMGRKSEFSISPNPSRGLFKFQSNEGLVYNLTIYNSLGAKVLEHKKVREVIDIDLGSFSNGIYLLQVQSANGNLSYQKLVKE